MYRYFSLVWNQEDLSATNAAEFVMSQLFQVSTHQWKEVHDSGGLVVFDAGAQKGQMQTYHLQNDGGVVLGRLFRNGGNGEYISQIDDLDDIQSHKILRSKTDHLAENYWGRYVTFLSDRTTGAKLIMRDPSGAFPCFFTDYKGVEIYYSEYGRRSKLRVPPVYTQP